MISQDTLTPLLRSYRYDGLNRIREQKVALPHNNAFTPTKSWNTSYTYDLMGNITTLKRNAGQEQPMDRLGYNYYPNTNRLAYVSDSVPAADFTHDIDHQQPANYTYDAVGNMTKDAMSEITVSWNDYGKIKDVRYLTSTTQPSTTAPLKLGFSYDALASRLTKTYYKQSGNTSHAIYTDVYVRDPQGNPIATYTLRNDSLFLDEFYIYGSQRVGLSKENRFLARKPLTPTPLAFIPEIKIPVVNIAIPNPQPQPLTLYTKRYELTDWLGNVRVVITNKKTPLQSAPLRYKPDVVSVTDYYAFGSEVRERSYNTRKYQFGFNGQIEDNEITGINGSHLSFEYRIYDSRLAKFLSVDPLSNKYPFWTPFQFCGNQVISTVELEGLEPEFDLNVTATASMTIGTRSQSSIGLNLGIGASTKLGGFQPGLNFGMNIYSGGLGTAQGVSKKNEIQGDFIVSPSITMSLGRGTTNQPMSVNTFNSRTLSGIKTEYKNAFTIASNIIFNTEGRNQQVGSLGFKFGNVSLHKYNDFFPFIGDKEDRWWSGGGFADILLNSGRTLSFGTEVFTGMRKTFADGYHYHKGQSQFGRNKYYIQDSSRSRSITNGQTFIRITDKNGINNFTLSISGGNKNMYSQSLIHRSFSDDEGVWYFNSTAKPSIQGTFSGGY